MDAGLDAGLDAVTEAAVDVAPDAGFDAGPDTSIRVRTADHYGYGTGTLVDQSVAPAGLGIAATVGMGGARRTFTGARAGDDFVIHGVPDGPYTLE